MVVFFNNVLELLSDKVTYWAVWGQLKIKILGYKSSHKTLSSDLEVKFVKEVKRSNSLWCFVWPCFDVGERLRSFWWKSLSCTTCTPFANCSCRQWQQGHCGRQLASPEHQGLCRSASDRNCSSHFNSKQGWNSQITIFFFIPVFPHVWNSFKLIVFLPCELRRHLFKDWWHLLTLLWCYQYNVIKARSRSRGMFHTLAAPGFAECQKNHYYNSIHL